MKTLLKVVAVLAVLAIAAVVLVVVLLDNIVETGMEQVIGYVTESNVEAEGVDLQPFNGRLIVDSLAVGNPPGFPTDSNVLDMKGLDVAIDTASLTGDQPHLKLLQINELTVELRQADGKINLFVLEERLKELSGETAPAEDAPAPDAEPAPEAEPDAAPDEAPAPAPESDSESGSDAEPAPPAEAAPEKTYKVDKVRITGVMLSTQDLELGIPLPNTQVPLPDIELDDLEGDMSEITLQVVEQLVVNTVANLPGLGELRAAGEAAVQAAADAAAEAERVAGEAAEQAGEAANQAIEGAGDAARDAVGGATEGVREGLGNLLGGDGDNEE